MTDSAPTRPAPWAIRDTSDCEVSGWRVYDRWLNTETCERKFGIQARVGRTWRHVAEDHVALIFDSREAAEAKIAALGVKTESEIEKMNPNKVKIQGALACECCEGTGMAFNAIDAEWSKCLYCCGSGRKREQLAAPLTWDIIERCKMLRNRREMVDYGNGDVRDEPDEALLSVADALERLSIQLSARDEDVARLREQFDIMRKEWGEAVRDRAASARFADDESYRAKALEAKLSARDAEVARLREALVPFAKEAEGFAPAWMDRPDPNANSSPWYTLESPPGFTIADLRRARAALAAPVAEKGEE